MIDDDVREGLERRLVDVRALHARLVVTDATGQPDDLRHPETWAIFGTGVGTDMEIRFDGDTPLARQRAEGDGTVPLPSGAGLFSNDAIEFRPTVDLATQRQFVVSGVQHAQAMADASVLRSVRAILS